jgi:LPXTG-motif cell wall-anchored protein
MVVAADIPVSTPEPTTPTTPTTTPDSSAAPDGLATVLPFLPDTGASVRDVLIIAALLTTFGLLLLGGRRKSHSAANAG